MATTTLDYLIPDVRAAIGDYQAPYRYLDAWILSALVIAAKKFQRYNQTKYTVSTVDNLVYDLARNTASRLFTTSEATEGVIEKKDEPILILMASITMLEGSLENMAWNVGSWKDYEISYSNIESGRLRDGTLKRLQAELDALIIPPTRRLAGAYKQSLPGYKSNDYEREGDL